MSEALAHSVHHNLSLSDEAQPSPPWGALPAEQYLIRNWDWSSPQPDPDQTRTLVRAFLALDDIPEDWDGTRRRLGGVKEMQRVPTDDEVRTILQPWRPARWRDVGFQLWTKRCHEEAVWLRTHYGDGSDAKFAEWRAMDEDYDPNYDEKTVSWTVLDDAGVFDVGDEWWRVFDVLPELAGPLRGHARGPPYVDKDRVQALRGELRRDVERRLSSLVGGEHEPPEDAAILEAEYGEHGESLQVEAVSTFLLVADAGAWETDCLRLLYLDGKGNIVRHSAVEVSEAWETRNYWMGNKFRESLWWPHNHNLMTGERFEPGSELADKYRARGELGRRLYRLDL